MMKGHNRRAGGTAAALGSRCRPAGANDENDFHSVVRTVAIVAGAARYGLRDLRSVFIHAYRGAYPVAAANIH